MLFGVRPFWRNETSGSHFLAFNAILNWNDLEHEVVGTDDCQSGLTNVGRNSRSQSAMTMSVGTDERPSERRV